MNEMYNILSFSVSDLGRKWTTLFKSKQSMKEKYEPYTKWVMNDM